MSNFPFEIQTAAEQIVSQAQALAPKGYKAVPNSVVMFVNSKGKKADATGDFHQDGVALVGFFTLYAKIELPLVSALYLLTLITQAIETTKLTNRKKG